MIVKEEKQNNASGLLSLSRYDRETPDQHKQVGRPTQRGGRNIQTEIQREKQKQRHRQGQTELVG